MNNKYWVSLKKALKNKLGTIDNGEDLTWYLNHFPTGKERKDNPFSPMLLLDLIVPAINFFVLSKIIRFHRQGYQFMAVLGILALVQPENRVMPYRAMYLIIIGLSFFLLLRLFPEQELV